MNEQDLVNNFKKRIRSPFRPRASDIVKTLFPDFNYFNVPEQGSLLAGSCLFMGKQLLVIGQQKPKLEDMKGQKGPRRLNYGMLTADDHSFILNMLKNIPYSERENTCVFSIVDTYGADISMDSAQRFQAFFIAQLIRQFLTIPVRTVSLILGEGGSGGALAIQYADVKGQMSDAFYTTAAPESTASIVFRDPSRIGDAISVLRPTAAELQKLEIIDYIVPAPDNVKNIEETSSNIKHFLEESIKEIFCKETKTLIEQRAQKAKKFGLIKKDIEYDDKQQPGSPLKRTFRELPPNIGELRSDKK